MSYESEKNANIQMRKKYHRDFTDNDSSIPDHIIFSRTVSIFFVLKKQFYLMGNGSLYKESS